MAFKLAEAYTELKAKTTEHDRAIDNSVDKVKMYGTESSKVEAIGAKMFFAIGLGAGSAMAVIGKLASAVRDLGSRLLEAAKNGKGFGDEIARWLTDITGVENAVTKLDRRLKEEGAGGDAADKFRGFPAAREIAGLTPEKEKQAQAKRAELEVGLGAAAQALTEARGVFAAAQEEAERQRTAGGPSTGKFARPAVEGVFGINEPLEAFRQAELAFRGAEQAIRNHEAAIQDEIAIREKAIDDQREGGRIWRERTNQIDAALKNLGRGLGESAAETTKFALKVGEAGKVAGDRERRAERNEVAEIVAAAEQDIKNSGLFDKQDQVQKDRKRAALMGLEEFTSSIFTAAATGKDAEQEQREKEVLEQTKQINKGIKDIHDLQRRGPAAAVFAEGAIV